MPTYGVLMMLFLAAASIVGMIVFLTQFRARRAVAMLAFVATAFMVLVLCASTFMGASFTVAPMR
jgi:hypothetical protein